MAIALQDVRILIEEDTVDPAKVAGAALQNAASIAGLLVATDAMIAESRKDKPSIPMGGGMERNGHSIGCR